MAEAGQSVDRRHAGIALASGVALVGLSVAFVDRPLARFAHDGLHRPEWCVWLTWIADPPAPLSVLALILAGLAWLAGWRPGRAGRIALAVCMATLVAVEVKDVLKLATGRLWPETWVNHNPSWIGNGAYGFHPFHGGQGYASFPSGHTTAVSAPCAVLWRRVPAWRPVWVLAPVLVVAGLLGADFHFLSDCIAGAYLGVACAALVLAGAWL